jgi:CRISPR/Cas system-associated exonuclease Cas4 (RecB family)
MFDHGDHIHQLIMKPLLSIREIHVVASEVNIPPQELISGRSDAIISDGKELYVLDIKSMNSMIFKNLTEPKPENLDQIQLFMHYFKVPKGILLYVNKDTQELKEFLIGYDSVRSKKLLAELTYLKTEIESDSVPKRLDDWPDNWQCRYCQFKEICQIVGAKEINWDVFKKKMEVEKG